MRLAFWLKMFQLISSLKYLLKLNFAQNVTYNLIAFNWQIEMWSGVVRQLDAHYKWFLFYMNVVMEKSDNCLRHNKGYRINRWNKQIKKQKQNKYSFLQLLVICTSFESTAWLSGMGWLQIDEISKNQWLHQKSFRPSE